MDRVKSINLTIETNAGAVSAILDVPKKVVAGLTLAHGAGAGMRHPFMADLAAALTARGFAVLRFQFPYMEAGRKRVDTKPIAIETVAAALRVLRKRFPHVPLYVTGKSFGARMSTTAAAEGLLPEIAGIMCYGFPLHPAKQPAVERAKHLAKVPVKMLFLQGTRDDLADLKLLRKVHAKLARATLHIVEGADHGFGILKRSGRTPEDVMKELADASARFAIGKIESGVPKMLRLRSQNRRRRLG